MDRRDFLKLPALSVLTMLPASADNSVPILFIKMNDQDEWVLSVHKKIYCENGYTIVGETGQGRFGAWFERRRDLLDYVRMIEKKYLLRKPATHELA